jgi:hypothetical protein
MWLPGLVSATFRRTLRVLAQFPWQISAVSVITMGVNMSALGKSASWKEEVLLHDNTRMVVERSQTYGDRASLDSTERTVVEERWAFDVPGSGRKVTWSTGFSRPPEASCLMLMQVNFLNGVPYIATSPAGTLAYNHWGRPNPPYVFFKHDDKGWQRIPLAEFPAQFIESNVVVGGRPNPEKLDGGLLSLARVKEANRPLDTYLRQIVRQPITQGDGVWISPVMVYDGKGGWASPGGLAAPAPRKQPVPAN